MQSERDTLANELQQRIFQAIKPTLDAAVLPIAGIQGGVPVQVGTATLWAVGDRHFLISANHVFREANKYQVTLMIGDKGQHTDGISLGGSNAFGVSGQLDIGLIELSPEIVSGLKNRRLLRLTELFVGRLRPEDWCFVWGYPSTFSKSYEVRGHPGGASTTKPLD